MPMKEPNTTPTRVTGCWKALWRSLLARHDLEEHERVILVQACQTLDLCTARRPSWIPRGRLSRKGSGREPSSGRSSPACQAHGVACRRRATAQARQNGISSPGRHLARGTVGRLVCDEVGGASSDDPCPSKHCATIVVRRCPCRHIAAARSARTSAGSSGLTGRVESRLRARVFVTGAANHGPRAPAESFRPGHPATRTRRRICDGRVSRRRTERRRCPPTQWG
jgi:hypothetical protein